MQFQAEYFVRATSIMKMFASCPKLRLLQQVAAKTLRLSDSANPQDKLAFNMRCTSCTTVNQYKSSGCSGNVDFTIWTSEIVVQCISSYVLLLVTVFLMPFLLSELLCG